MARPMASLSSSKCSTSSTPLLPDLSVGFTIGEYNLFTALIVALIIGVITFAISFLGVYVGKKLGTKLTWQADVLGGVILIGIGIKILVSGVFG